MTPGALPSVLLPNLSRFELIGGDREIDLHPPGEDLLDRLLAQSLLERPADCSALRLGAARRHGPAYEVFGEIGLLIDRPRHASVIAKTDLQVLKITQYALQLLHQSAPDMAFLMYQMLARSLAEQLLNTSEMQRPE